MSKLLLIMLFSCCLANDYSPDQMKAMDSNWLDLFNEEASLMTTSDSILDTMEENIVDTFEDVVDESKKEIGSWMDNIADLLKSIRMYAIETLVVVGVIIIIGFFCAITKDCCHKRKVRRILRNVAHEREMLNETVL